MKSVFWFLFIAALAVALALLVGDNHATVTLFWHPYRIDLSFNLVLFALVGGFVLLYLALRGLALLRSLQDWQDAGGVLRDEDIHQSFQQRAASFGSALRIRWRLPFGLRELIAAFYNLGSGVFSREALVLNLVCQVLRLRSNQSPKELRDERCVRMLRLDLSLLERMPSV